MYYGISTVLLISKSCKSLVLPVFSVVLCFLKQDHEVAVVPHQALAAFRVKLVHQQL